jgi:hypothetical protein
MVNWGASTSEGKPKQAIVFVLAADRVLGLWKAWASVELL